MALSEEFIKISIELKFTEKRLERSAKKLEQEASKKRNLLLAALKKGNEEHAKIHAESVIRIKKDVTLTQILAARVSGLRMRVEEAKMTKQLSAVMTNLVTQLQSDQMMSVSHVQTVMDKFETANENMEVMNEVLDKTMSKATVANEAPQDVDSLIAEIAEQNSLELNLLLPTVAQKVQAQKVEASAAPSIPTKAKARAAVV